MQMIHYMANFTRWEDIIRTLQPDMHVGRDQATRKLAETRTGPFLSMCCVSSERGIV
jgi:hypothetical protein